MKLKKPLSASYSMDCSFHAMLSCVKISVVAVLCLSSLSITGASDGSDIARKMPISSRRSSTVRSASVPAGSAAEEQRRVKERELRGESGGGTKGQARNGGRPGPADPAPSSSGPAPATTVDLVIPSMTLFEADEYVCSSWMLPDGKNYITEFETLVPSETVVYMALYGCTAPADPHYHVWRKCSRACDKDSMSMNAWARYAPHINIPKDVGFAVGDDTGLSYIVLQIHYQSATQATADSSGFRISLSTARPKYIAGIFVMALEELTIPAGTKKVHGDITCSYKDDDQLQMIGYRVHAHDLGQVITGYRVDNNGSWNLLGKGNPQWPQSYYPTPSDTTIRKGDRLVIRCTYDTSARTSASKIGISWRDEMCNMYLLCYTNATVGVPYYSCAGNNYPQLLTSIPPDSDQPLPRNAQLESTGGEAKPHTHASPPPAAVDYAQEVTGGYRGGSEGGVYDSGNYRGSKYLRGSSNYRDSSVRKPPGYSDSYSRGRSSYRGDGRNYAMAKVDNIYEYPQDDDLAGSRQRSRLSSGGVEDSRPDSDYEYQALADDSAGQGSDYVNEVTNQRSRDRITGGRDQSDEILSDRRRRPPGAETDQGPRTRDRGRGQQQQGNYRRGGLSLTTSTETKTTKSPSTTTISSSSASFIPPIAPTSNSRQPSLGPPARSSGGSSHKGYAEPSDFGASLIIVSILVVPVLVILGVVIFLRARKSGKLHWLNQNRRHGAVSAAVGGLVPRRHKAGFERLRNGGGKTERDELERLNNGVTHSEDDSEDLEEFSITPHQKA